MLSSPGPGGTKHLVQPMLTQQLLCPKKSRARKESVPRAATTMRALTLLTLTPVTSFLSFAAVNLRIYSLLEDEPGLRYCKNIAIEELSLSRCAYYESRIARRGHAARASVSGKRGRRARRAAAAVWFQ